MTDTNELTRLRAENRALREALAEYAPLCGDGCEKLATRVWRNGMESCDDHAPESAVESKYAILFRSIDTALSAPPAREGEVVWKGEYPDSGMWACVDGDLGTVYLWATVQLETDVPHGFFLASVSVGNVHARAGLLPDMDTAKLRAVELWHAIRHLAREGKGGA